MNKGASKGLVQIYTGKGKGKTTAALGLALRSVGQGMKVIIIQFVKGDHTCGEHLFVAKYHPFNIVELNIGDSFTQTLDELRPVTQQTLAFAEETIVGGSYNMVILDEIFVARKKGLITTEQIKNLMNKKPEGVELVLTGRGAPEEIIQQADLVTEMLAIKHPFTKGITKRKGIEC
ncbi:MAG TPA: cob(I)yrinic acid a,c-diamide adenosyltransferase [Dehalococcoidia bacterium]|nr:cob(I)yrinic acid a,c-diamide adenosyltransferase [Dehalococcoidia bacterium]